VLTVDLWNHDASVEANLVQHSNTSPALSISAATTTTYPPPPEPEYFGILNQLQFSSYYRNVQYGAVAPTYQQPSPSTPTSANGFQTQTPYVQAANVPIPIVPMPTANRFTRNLIGSLAVNAFKLNDDQGTLGLWFVLQDLSVRTEGNFRLKCSLVDVGSGKAPVLATIDTDTFQVYSAKKFPGVIESTPLSKVFAGQGIKIPIRKDGPKNARDEE
jgi:hypothetical protein